MVHRSVNRSVIVLSVWMKCFQRLLPVCDHGLFPLGSPVKVRVAGDVCEATAGPSHHCQGVGVQLPRHLQAKILLHLSEGVVEGVQRAAPDTVGGTDTYLREELGQILLDKEKPSTAFS